MTHNIKIGQKYIDEDGAIGLITSIKQNPETPLMDQIGIYVTVNGEFIHNVTRKAYIVRMEKLLK